MSDAKRPDGLEQALRVRAAGHIPEAASRPKNVGVSHFLLTAVVWTAACDASSAVATAPRMTSQSAIANMIRRGLRRVMVTTVLATTTVKEVMHQAQVEAQTQARAEVEVQAEAVQAQRQATIRALVRNEALNRIIQSWS